jgi:hypothetical protein
MPKRRAMNEADRIAIPDALPDALPDASSGAPSDPGTLIASLRAAGADRLDPVRLRYIEALAKRATAHQGNARRLLDAKLAQALATLKERVEHARSEASETVARGAQQYPQAAGDLQRLFAAGDVRGLRRSIASLKANEQCAALRMLTRQLDQHAPDDEIARSSGNAGPRSELKTIRNFRHTWSKLSVDRQVAQALEQAPKNAGPINSHMLVLRSLTAMRDISPDYLSRFMSYADTLLSLDQGEPEKAVIPKKPPAIKTAKAVKTAKTPRAQKK